MFLAIIGRLIDVEAFCAPLKARVNAIVVAQYTGFAHSRLQAIKWAINIIFSVNNMPSHRFTQNRKEVRYYLRWRKCAVGFRLNASSTKVRRSLLPNMATANIVAGVGSVP